ncbi:MAG: hypothetical protein LH615_07640 [Ferruginibacter sp.]|nr:hypothetical protein [Ferruginibacter sp.]
MRENKYDKLLLLSVILIIASSVLLAISGYNVYFKSEEVKQFSNKNPTGQPTLKLRDSLERIYSNTVSDIKNNLHLSSTLEDEEEIKTKIIELDTLKEEIKALLSRKNNNNDLLLAKVKIEELQQKVYFLQSKYSNVETENMRLQKLINQLISSKSGNASTPSNYVVTEKIKPASEKISNGNTAIAAGLHLFAVVNNNAKEQETTAADDAEKIVGTFIVKNLPAKGNGELLIVVLQPDGKVVKNSVWESGTFETAEGKKIYSRKIYTETSAEEKQLNFSLTPDRFLKGDYTLQIWYNGNMIGKMIKTLS